MDTETYSETNMETDTETDMETDTETDMETDTETYSDTETDMEAETETDMNNKMSNIGGARPGSGPKVKGPYKRRSVCIDDKMYDLVKAYGDGNFSVGIRKLCKLLEMTSGS